MQGIETVCQLLPEYEFQSYEKKIKEKNMESPTSYNAFWAKIDCVVFPTYK